MNNSIIIRHPFFKISIAIVAFLVVILFGTIGFMVIEHFSFEDAVYMTVITISTVGFTEVHPLNSAGRWFTIALIIVNLSLLTFFVSYITRYFLDGHFQKFYKKYRMKNQINHLKGHVIICGFGRNGQAAARMLIKSGKQVVIIETKELSTEFENEIHYYFQGDATQDQVLLDARIDHASALITTLPTDADNLFIVLTAREINSKLKIISRASADSSIKKLVTAGANEVLMPDKIGGIHMATMIIQPDVKEFIDYLSFQVSDVGVLEIEVSKVLRIGELDSWNKTGVTILGIHLADKSYKLNPEADTILNSGDRLIVLGNEKQVRQLRKMVE